MKKLLNKKGSVLFLVVVVMSILLVVASATYYIVSNQRQSVEVHYNSEQSYQTAYSVSQNVSNYIDNVVHSIQNTPSLYNSKNIVKEMMALEVDGPSMKTDSIDLRELGLGEDINVEIKKSKVDGDINYFEIITTAVVNGEVVRMVQVKAITLSESETKYFTRFLTSTGNRLEDVSLSVCDIYGDAYFENDYTFLGNPTRMQKSLYSAGTLSDGGIQFQNAADLEIATLHNYYIDSAAGTGTMSVNRLLTGGDLVTVSGGQKQIAPEVAYIMGNAYLDTYNHEGTYFIQGDCHINANQQSDGGATFYINGDLYVGENATVDLNHRTFYVKGNVYLGPKTVRNNVDGSKIIMYGGELVDNSQEHSGSAMSQETTNIYDLTEQAFKEKSEATKTSDNVTFSNWHDVSDYISSVTAKGTYKSWKAEKYFDDNFTSAPTIKLDDENNPAVEHQPNTQKYKITITQNCILQPADAWQDWGSQQGKYILIDTDAAGKEIYIKLDAGSRNTFSFGPNGTNSRAFVLVKGQYPVIFILPDGTNFQMDGFSFVGHLDTALQRSGCHSFDELYNNSIDVHSYFDDETDDDETDIAPLNQLLKQKEIKNDKGEVEKVVTTYDASKFTAINDHTPTPHNNIFLVSTSKTNDLNFNAQSTFCGYIYAPSLTFNVDNGYHGVAFFGGVIVGSYTYTGITATLIFADPYDPYTGKENNIVTYLMSQANGSDDEDVGGTKKKTEISYYETLGYK